MKLLITFVKHCSPIQQISVDSFINYLGKRISEVLENSDGTFWCSADMHLWASFRYIHTFRHLEGNSWTWPTLLWEKNSSKLICSADIHTCQKSWEDGGTENFSPEFRSCLHTLTPQITLQSLKIRSLLLSDIAKCTGPETSSLSCMFVSLYKQKTDKVTNFLDCVCWTYCLKMVIILKNL